MRVDFLQVLYCVMVFTMARCLCLFADQVNTEYVKVLVASAQQIQTSVIEEERQALKMHMTSAEVSAIGIRKCETFLCGNLLALHDLFLSFVCFICVQLCKMVALRMNFEISIYTSRIYQLLKK